MEFFKQRFLKLIDKKLNNLNGRANLIHMAGIVGIFANALFAVIKIIIGISSNSIAIISDAINNMIDTSSSIITLVGLKLAQRPPDREHPWGHGRIEYLSAMLVSVLIIVTGIELLRNSIDRIITPEYTHFAMVQIIVLSIMIIGKAFLAYFNTTIGKKADSDALVAAGTDCKMDVLISLLTVIAAIVSKYTNFYIDGYLGLLLSLFIIYTGIDLIRDTISSLIGECPDKKLVDKIIVDVLQFKPIIGAHDLVLHNYGPVTKLGSLNVEIPDYVSVESAYDAMDAAQLYIYTNYEIYLVFGLYSVNTYDKNIIRRLENVKHIISKIHGAVNLHNFRYYDDNDLFRFDVVVDSSVDDVDLFKKQVIEAVQKKYPDATFNVDIDFD